MTRPAACCTPVLSLLLVPALAFGQAVNIDHTGVGCVVAGKFPRFDARLDPAASVARARLHFRPEGGPHWYFVDMKSEAGLFRGILPKPQSTLHRFSYYIDVTDKTGTVTNWGFELTSPNVLMRQGWSRNSLKIGDSVSIEGFGAKDGSHAGNTTLVVLSTGQRLFAGTSQQSTP